MKLKIEVNSPEKVFEALELKEHSVYLILVKHRANNPTHESFLFTGFKNGNYCQIMNNTGSKVDMMNVFSIKIIKRLHTKKEYRVKNNITQETVSENCNVE